MNTFTNHHPHNYWTQETRLKLFHTAIQQATDHVIITDLQGNIEYVNPAFEKTTDYRLHEIAGNNCNILKSGSHPPEFYKQLWNTILRGNTFRAVFINLKKNGQIYWEDKRISPIRDESGKITHFLSVGHDVTHEHQKALESQKAKLLEDFISSASHDFRTPLTILKLKIHELEALDEEGIYADKWNALQRQIHYLERLTENILIFCRLKNESPVTFAPVDLNELIQDVADRTSPLFTYKAVGLNLNLDGAKPILFGNAMSLNRMLSNLVENALKFTARGGSVRIKSSTHNDYIKVSVSDNGSGIAVSQLPLIFDTFYHYASDIPDNTDYGMD